MRRSKEVVPEYVPGQRYSNSELGALADELLREDARSELCRTCGERGEKTGESILVDQPLEDESGAALVLQFPEYSCVEGHCWYQGEGAVRGIGGENPILFEEHIQSRRRREILNTLGTPDPSIVSGIYNRCVDDQTEALTPQGWRGSNDLAVGDLIWAYDIETDTYDWSPVLDVYRTEHRGQLMALESKQISARVTEGHRWPVVHERDKTQRYAVDTVLQPPSLARRDPVTGRMLKGSQPTHLAPRHYIPLARPPLDDAFASDLEAFELLGWIIADGSYKSHHAGMVLTQAMHNPKRPAMEVCLAQNGQKIEPHYVDENNVGRWYIDVQLGERLRQIAPQKLLASIDYTQHTPSQLNALLSGVIYGDGSLRPSEVTSYVGRMIFTTQRREADAAQALCTVLGITSSQTWRYAPDAFCPMEYFVYLKEARRSSFAYVRTALQEPVAYNGEVWCPSVATGFWLARRNGKVYATGNSHPQGRRVNTAEARAKHGASYYRS